MQGRCVFVSVGILKEKIRRCARRREGVCCPIERAEDEEGHSAQLSGHALEMSDMEVLGGSTKICGMSA